MGWKADWKKWSQTTYGLVHAVCVCDRSGALSDGEIEQSFHDAGTWTTPSLGFVSAAIRKPMRSSSIQIEECQTVELVGQLKADTIDALLICTVAITESLLSDLIVLRKVKRTAPNNFSGILSALQKKLKQDHAGRYAKCAWAFQAAHEMRVLRNCIVHAGGKWTQEGVDELSKYVPGRPPSVGSKIVLGIDDIMSYRRCSRTLLNAADQCR
ncbi:MAG: hypothetical protein U0836_26945 [Pirellulales bacterium]